MFFLTIRCTSPAFYIVPITFSQFTFLPLHKESVLHLLLLLWIIENYLRTIKKNTCSTLVHSPCQPEAHALSLTYRVLPQSPVGSLSNSSLPIPHKPNTGLPFTLTPFSFPSATLSSLHTFQLLIK